jgi:4-hydroxybenzoate polyprenyltransferase
LETFLILINRNILYLLCVPFWLLKGKANLKAEIAKRVKINPDTLPYNLLFIEWLQAERNTGRTLWLCTATNYRLANVVAEYLDIFSGVLASSDETNLSGRAKAVKLVEQFGKKRFYYCANNYSDLVIWQFSKGAVAVNCSKRLIKQIGNLTEIHAVFPKINGTLKLVLKAVRPHQWAKNILVFVPLVAAQKILDLGLAEHALIAFFAFVFCASSVYLINDLLDLEADRKHPTKCKRTFASGNLPLILGFIFIPLLASVGLCLAASLPAMFVIVLFGYCILAVAYSLILKHIVLVDILTLAILYTVRIIAGAMAIDVQLSFWLLLFSIFIFLSLALVKRYAELDGLRRQGKLMALGRGYHIEDLPILHSFGAVSGYLSVLILALYINSPAVESLYQHPQVIWFLCLLLLFWISHVWLKTHRGLMNDDPIIFALKDRVSLFVGALAVITISFAI